MLGFFETDNRDSILIRHDSLKLLEDWSTYLNTDCHRCLIIKKDASNLIFIVNTVSLTLEMLLQYDDERYCFKVIECNRRNSLEDIKLEINKVTHIDRNFELAVKPEGKRYKNRNSLDATEGLFDEASQLDRYDVVIEELRRQEEARKLEALENEKARKQLEVWTQYVSQKQDILESANKPFVLSPSEPNIRKNFADVEVESSVASIADSAMLRELSKSIGGKVNGNMLEMYMDEFHGWQNSQNEKIDAKIYGAIIMKMRAGCDTPRAAGKFKEARGYGREFYYQYDRQSQYVELTYRTTNKDNLFEFYRNVYDFWEFKWQSKESEVKLSFKLKVTTTEPADERRKRIDILTGRELYSKPNMGGVYLGTLSRNGSDRRHIRILFPKEEKDRQAAKEFLLGQGDKTIYPGLVKDKVLLDRELKALNKIRPDSFDKLTNELLKDFIFNSSRAQATEEFVGLTHESLAATRQYIDCQDSKMLTLNASQQEAVVKGLYAKDLCLLQGPPGTGKTTVISELIWQHIRKNQKVRIMLTSQTNLAIDNALNRLFSNSAINVKSPAWRNMMLIKPIRIADSEIIEEEGKPFSIERIDGWVAGDNDVETSNNIVYRWMKHIEQRVSTDEEYAEYQDILSEWKSSLRNPATDLRKVFATQYKKDTNVLCMTCGKVGSADFGKYEGGRGFDVVIVDEASKATLPELVMPLCYAQKSIIIGDHRQLPPVIFEEDFFKVVREADPDFESKLDSKFKKALVDESLFKRLILHPSISPTIKATFNVQYRMHPCINDIVSQFYAADSGGLTCGLNPVKVDAPNFAEKDSRYHGFSLEGFIQPNVHTIWVDVPDGMEQGGEGSSTFNEKEVEAVGLVIEALSKAKGFDSYMNYWSQCPSDETRITESKIGVISFYAAQVQRLRSRIQSFCDRRNIKFTTKSVDRYQGQESGIVIVSTVRTRRLGFTKTPERLNVALSRARRLLIIVGNSDFYSLDFAKTDGVYGNVIKCIKSPDNTDVFIDYRDLKNILGNSYE